MDRLTGIYKHPLYRKELAAIAEGEKDRVFCGHDFKHFMDVARIGRILCLERDLDISKELVYAAALLHDIGRARQYHEGMDHDQAGALIAARILPECAFSKEETELVCQAIEGHSLSKDGSKERTALGQILHEADHLSRECFLCPAEKECYWPENKKNMEIRM